MPHHHRSLVRRAPSSTLPTAPTHRADRHRAGRAAHPGRRPVPLLTAALLAALTGAGGAAPSAAPAVDPVRVEGTLAPGSIRLAAADAEDRVVEPSRSQLRRDRTRPGSPELSAAGVSRLVAPARVVRGERLEPKPPPWRPPVTGYRLTARFGASGLWASTHTGLDFAAPEGTPLHAVGAATVESAGYEGAYGNKVVLRLADGTRLWYCHLSTVAVSRGDRVAAGGTVGTLGSTGNSTGPHLHLEVRPGGGEPIDPEPWLVERGLL